MPWRNCDTVAPSRRAIWDLSLMKEPDRRQGSTGPVRLVVRFSRGGLAVAPLRLVGAMVTPCVGSVAI